MPRQILDKNEVTGLLPKALEVRLVKGKDESEGVKLKLRTKDTLFTFKTSKEEAEALLKGQKVEILEF